MKVKYFAWVRERVGKAEEMVEPPASVRTVDDLMAWLARRDESYAYAFERPRVIRAARFFWKMPRYTTSQIRADMRSPSCQSPRACTVGRLV